jgi:hypothetical protein
LQVNPDNRLNYFQHSGYLHAEEEEEEEEEETADEEDENFPPAIDAR